MSAPTSTSAPMQISLHQAVAATCRMVLEGNNENAKKMAQMIKQQTQLSGVNAIMDSILERNIESQANTIHSLATAIHNKISTVMISEKDKEILDRTTHDLQQNQQREFAEKLTDIIQNQTYMRNKFQNVLDTANQYVNQYQYEKAISLLEEIPQEERSFLIWDLMTVCATRIRDHKKMREYAQNAAKVNPGDPRFLTKWGMMELFLAQHENGFKLFESRLNINQSQYKPPVQSPMWNGAPFPAATLFVYQEHGIGDVIQFIRYLPIIRQYGEPNGKIILACKPSLKRLLDTLPKTYADHVIEFEHHMQAPEHNFHISLYSMPFVLDRRLKRMGIKKSYIKVNPHEISTQKGYKKIGIIWKSSTIDGPNKSIPKETLKILKNVKNAHFFSLQFERDENYDIENQEELDFIDTSLQPYNMDFLDLAQNIAGLDGLIAIDTAAAHIAGAMFKPTIVVLPHIDIADWRWQKGNYKKSLYPTMTLLPCKKFGDWESALEKIVKNINGKQFP